MSTSFTIEQIYAASIAIVWRAITDKEEMKQWYFHLKEFKAEPGFEFEFLAGEQGKEYLHRCKVTEVITGRKIAYTWRYDGYAGDSLVTYELSENGKNTKLRLTHSGLNTFPADNPAFAEKNFATGWEYITGISLKGYFDKVGTH